MMEDWNYGQQRAERVRLKAESSKERRKALRPEDWNDGRLELWAAEGRVENFRVTKDGNEISACLLL
jgi:hypothetical protein